MCKEYFAFKVPATAQKANGSPPPEESKTKRRPRCLGT